MNNTLGSLLKKISVAFLLSIALMQATAQCRISVKSPDSLAFIINIGETMINQWPCLGASFDFPQSGKINAKVSFPSHVELNFAQAITLKKNYSHFFEVEKSKGAFKLVLKSESLLEKALPVSPMADSQSATMAQNNNTSIAETDSTASNSSGCGAPADQSAYEKMLADVKEGYFETRKLETMKSFINSNCVSVEQLRFMMSKLSMEDNKIILVKHARGHVSDVRNIRKVEEDFFLQKNKALVSEITQGFYLP
jgi:hypothetical protein